MAKIHLNDLDKLIVSMDETGKTWVILSVKQYDTVLQLVEVAKAAKETFPRRIMLNQNLSAIEPLRKALDKLGQTGT